MPCLLQSPYSVSAWRFQGERWVVLWQSGFFPCRFEAGSPGLCSQEGSLCYPSRGSAGCAGVAIPAFPPWLLPLRRLGEAKTLLESLQISGLKGSLFALIQPSQSCGVTEPSECFPCCVQGGEEEEAWMKALHILPPAVPSPTCTPCAGCHAAPLCTLRHSGVRQCSISIRCAQPR